MNVQTKIGGAVFEHRDDFKGDVTITRNGATVTVPLESLRRLVAESVRALRIAALRDAKPEDLLKGPV